MKVAVYLSGVPKKSKNEFKRSILTRFANGAKISGDDVYLVDDPTIVGCDVAVIQGWIGMKSAPHLNLRRQVIKQQSVAEKHTLVMDSNLFGFLAPDDFNRYLRYSLDDIFPTTGYYFDQRPDPSRWSKIKHRYGFQERDWTTNGQNILVTLQRNGGWSMGEMPVQKWLNDAIPKIRRHSDRPIVIRPHPGNLNIVSDIVLPPVGKISWSDNADIRQDLDRAWVTVTYNSSPGVASLLWGIPVFITDQRPEKSQAHPLGNTDLSLIETPARPDRQSFYTKLSQCHWSGEEIDSGEAWQFMRQRLPKIPLQ